MENANAGTRLRFMILTRRNLILAAIVVGALVLEAAILIWFFNGGDEDSDDPSTARAPAPESRLTENDRCGSVSSQRGETNSRFVRSRGYAVEVPARWKSDVEGSVITLTKRNGRASLSLGRARPGDLAGALDDLRASLRRTYPHLEVTRVEPILLDGCPARSILGRAGNRLGARLNFESVVVSGPTANFVIAGFLERGAEPRLDSEVSRAIRSVELFVSEGRARS
jgi:hypothetical protein